MLKTIIEKLERIKIMTWMLMWLNESVATINVSPQLLDILVTNPSYAWGSLEILFKYIIHICFLY